MAARSCDRHVFRLTSRAVDTSSVNHLISTTRHLRAALDDVQRDPRDAERIANDVLASTTLASADRAMALWLLGRAQHELDRVDDACQTLESARALSLEAGDEVLAAEIAVSEAVCWMTVGDTDRSLKLLDDAEPRLVGGPLGRLVMQRGLIDLYRGALHPALASFDAGLPLLDAAHDEVARCRLLANRGVIHTQLGNLAHGLDDFSECRRLAVSLDQGMIAAGAAHNLGFLSGRRGEFPEALQWFETARSEYAEVGTPHRAIAVLESDRCAMLLGAGLVDEAIVSATRAEIAATSSGNQIAQADAQMQLAQAQLAANQHEAAAHHAERASASFRALDREPMAALSDYVAMRATAERDGSLDADGRSLLMQLVEHGWVNEAQDVRLFIGEQAWRAGNLNTVDDVLGDAAEARRSPSWALRAGGWYATALRRLGDGNRSGANRALGVGVKIVDQYSATIGASDLRAHTTAHSAGLIDLGLQLALADNDSRRLFAWAERAQARSMELQPARPVGTGSMLVLLGELRGAVAASAEATAAGEYDPAAHRRVGELEAKIRNEDRTAQREQLSGNRNHRVAAEATDDPEGVGVGVGDAVLVEYVDIDGTTHALVLDGAVRAGRRAPDVARIGAATSISHLLAHALGSLRRLALGSPVQRTLDASAESLTSLADELDSLLIAPLGLPPGVPVVIVPTPALRAMPWSVLPELANRAVAVAPSATVWNRRPVRRSSSAVRVVLVAGPGLEHADAEIEMLAAHHAVAGADVVRLDGADATVERVLDEFEGADIVHIAAHGTFRNDSPMFSAIHLHDGPLTVYDLETVTTPPGVVVLSACDAGRVAVRGGGELLGTAAALLQIGVSTVVAPVVAVSDRAARALMDDLHRRLASGADVAHAVGAAQVSARERGEHVDRAAGTSFIVLAGDRATPT